MPGFENSMEAIRRFFDQILSNINHPIHNIGITPPPLEALEPPGLPPVGEEPPIFDEYGRVYPHWFDRWGRFTGRGEPPPNPNQPR